MDSFSTLLSSVTCNKCHTSLIQSIQEESITKYKCKCGEKARMLLICTNCKKAFLNFPYLRRKTNYCSLYCYRVGTNKKQSKTCKVCGKNFFIKEYLARQGFGFYCSRDCWFSVFEEWKKTVSCKQCKNEFSVHRSVFKKNPKFCSKICADDFKRDYVERICRNCKLNFNLPRWELNKGKGSFCSWQCFKKFDGETSIERKIRLELQKLKEPFKQEAKFGRYHADFLLPKRNLIIECDGEYWHREKAYRDFKKDEFLQNKGFKVLRLTEEHIKNQKPEILRAIIQFASPD